MTRNHLSIFSIGTHWFMLEVHIRDQPQGFGKWKRSFEWSVFLTFYEQCILQLVSLPVCSDMLRDFGKRTRATVRSVHFFADFQVCPIDLAMKSSSSWFEVDIVLSNLTNQMGTEGQETSKPLEERIFVWRASNWTVEFSMDERDHSPRYRPAAQPSILWAPHGNAGAHLPGPSWFQTGSSSTIKIFDRLWLIHHHSWEAIKPIIVNHYYQLIFRYQPAIFPTSTIGSRYANHLYQLFAQPPP